MADTVSYKGYLNINNEKEVRRFMVDKSAASSYDYLVEKIRTVFPSIRNKIVKISWVDEEGDNVIIANDEELMIALTEMPGPLYKVNVTVKDVQGGGNSDAAMDTEGMEGEEHPNVSCDGCEGPVRGYRYKCLVCPDYDLCAKCERKGLHSGHNMMRMSSAQGTWPHHLFRKINRMQERMEQRARSRTEEQANNGEEGGDKQPQQGNGQCGFQNQWFGRGRGGGAGRGRGGWGGPCRGFRGFGPWVDWPSMAANPAAAGNNAEQVAKSAEQTAKDAEQTARDAEAAAKVIHEALHQAAMASTGAASAMAAAFAGDSSATASSNANEEYLRNVGNMVAAAMDPFGVNVDISIETPEGVRTKVASTSSSSTTTSSNDAKSPEENVAATTVSTANTAVDEEKMDTQEEVSLPEVINIPISRESTPEKEQSVEKETINNKEKSVEKEVANSSDEEDWTIVKEGSKTSEEAKSAGSLYPAVPTAEDAMETVDKEMSAVEISAPAVQPEQQQQVASHPDPKIQVALQAMMNMGFNNEGGWLATLLEAKQGDIGKVLDLLQPVKK